MPYIPDIPVLIVTLHQCTIYYVFYDLIPCDILQRVLLYYAASVANDYSIPTCISDGYCCSCCGALAA